MGVFSVNNFIFSLSHISDPATDTLWGLVAHVRYRLMHGWHEAWGCCERKPLIQKTLCVAFCESGRCYIADRKMPKSCQTQKNTADLTSYSINDNEKNRESCNHAVMLMSSFMVSRLMLHEVINLIYSEIALIIISHFCWRHFVYEIGVNQMVWNLFLENEE